jgi:hypothetical protein
MALERLRRELFGADPDAREAAIVVLAQSSRDEALDLLLEHVETAPLPADRASALRALGLHRTDRALAIALQTIASGEPADAQATIAGLAARRFDPGLRTRVEEAARRNADAEALDAAIQAAFGARDDGEG